MSLIAKTSEGSGTPRVEEGSYAAVCCGVVDAGVQHIKYENTEKDVPQVVIIWELPSERYEKDGKDRPITIFKTYTNSLHDKSSLRKDLKSWRGREFSDDELAGFDLTNVLGVPCMLQVIHKPTANGTFANIASIMSLPKGMPKPTGELEPLAFDIDTATIRDLELLPSWLQKKVKDSLSWQQRESLATANEPAFSELSEDDEDLPF